MDDEAPFAKLTLLVASMLLLELLSELLELDDEDDDEEELDLAVFFPVGFFSSVRAPFVENVVAEPDGTEALLDFVDF